MDRLLDKRLWIVSGKGGVGKSTISTALAVLFASRGERTLLCEVNASDRFANLVGGGRVGPEIVALADQLWAVNLQPEASLREYALSILKFESIYKAVFENRLVSYFLRFIPSIQELVMLGKIIFHVEERLESGEPTGHHRSSGVPSGGDAGQRNHRPWRRAQGAGPRPKRPGGAERLRGRTLHRRRHRSARGSPFAPACRDPAPR